MLQGPKIPISNPQRPTFIRRRAKAFAILAPLGAVGAAALLGALWVEHKTDITLPTPTGPFAVGREIAAWADVAHHDTLAPAPGAKRELMLWIWYPAADATAVVADYMPADWRAAEQFPPIFRLLTRDLSKVHAHSVRDADVSLRQGSYPVVIMRGGASANVVFYTTLAEDLASHGYVVVGFDAPYRSNVVVFPDGRIMRRQPENNPELCVGRADQEVCANRILNAWTSDIAFVLDRLTQLNASDPSRKFTGRLDMTRVGVFGHSFGGAAAALFCQQDSRCRAGIDVDGAPHGDVIQAGIGHPFMFLMSDHSHESDPQGAQIMANIQSIYDRLPPDARFLVTIRGANHLLFSDDGALLKSHLVMTILRVFGVLGIEGRRQLAVTTYCIHDFFGAYLKGPTVSPLKLSSPQYPEVQVRP